MYDDDDFRKREERIEETKSQNSLRCRIFGHKWDRKVKYGTKICDRCGAYKKQHE